MLRGQTFVPESKVSKMPIAAAASNSFKITEKRIKGATTRWTDVTFDNISDLQVWFVGIGHSLFMSRVTLM